MNQSGLIQLLTRSYLVTYLLYHLFSNYIYTIIQYQSHVVSESDPQGLGTKCPDYFPTVSRWHDLM